MVLAAFLYADLNANETALVMPFDLDVWSHGLRLAGYPRDLYKYIMDGLRQGFKLQILPGAQRPTRNGHVSINMAPDQQYAVCKWLREGIQKGYLLGPYCHTRNNHGYKPCPIKDLIVSPTFVIPKPHQLGEAKKWRTINHMSYPKDGISVNSCINPDWCTVQYVGFKAVVAMVRGAGVGAYLWIVDALDAYYRVPVHPSDWKYLGLSWMGCEYVMTCLPMGLSSACRIYTHFADAVLAIACAERPDLFFQKHTGRQQADHYLDDFFGINSDKKLAQEQFEYLQDLFKRLGIPTRPHKCHPPHTTLKLLGWVYDTVKQLVTLSVTKYTEIMLLIAEIYESNFVTKKQLEHLVGNLMLASMVVFPGKAFLRRFHMAMYGANITYQSHIAVTHYMRSDLEWWKQALLELNKVGLSFDFILKGPKDADINVYSDAAVTAGGGAWSQTGVCFSFSWDQTILFSLIGDRPYYMQIELLELLVLVLTAHLWGYSWSGKSVTLWTDSSVAYWAVRNKYAALHRKDMNFLVRKLAQLAVEHHFLFWTEELSTHENRRADYLSRQIPIDIPDTVMEPTKLVVQFVNELLCEMAKEPLNDPDPARIICVLYQ